MRDVLTSFVREGVVNDDDTFTGPASVISLLEKLQPLFVQLVFVQSILGKELVKGAFAFGRENQGRYPFYGLVAGRNKTCHVRFRVEFLPRRETFELVDWLSTRQERREREHYRLTVSLRAPPT